MTGTQPVQDQSAGRNLIYRLYREEGFVLKTKRPRRHKMAIHREQKVRPLKPNQARALDFVHDQLTNGQKLRALTVVDVYTRKALAIEIGHRLGAERVVEVLNRLVRPHMALGYLTPAEYAGEAKTSVPS